MYGATTRDRLGLCGGAVELRMRLKNFPEEVVFDLSDCERAQLTSWAQDVAQENISNPGLYRHGDVLKAVRKLDGPSFDAMRRFAESSNDYGTLLLRNVPIDTSLPPTPHDGRRPDNMPYLSESVGALLGCLLGDIFSYGDEKEGLLIQNICPVFGQENLQENTGSVFLEFHTEDSFHPFPPDYLILMCLRGDRTGQAITATASLGRVIGSLDEEVIETLAGPNYIIRSSSSFGASKYRRRTAIIGDPQQGRGLVFDLNGMEALSDVAEQAMQRLRQALEREAYGICLTPGDAIIIDNNKSCHARTGFRPYYDGRDRWLQRIFISRDFARMQDMLVPGTRMIDPEKSRELVA